MVKIRRIFFIGVIACIFLLAGTEWTGAGEIELNQDSNGKVLEVQNGQFLTILLPSNPTTGYSWQKADDPAPGVLVQKGHDYKSDYSPHLIGAGGTEYWRFQAVGEGSTTIRLMYMRPWESVQPLKTFSVDVRVSDSASPAINVIVFKTGVPYYIVNDQIPGILMDVSPLIKDNQTFVPVRFLGNALGVTDDNITWDNARQTAILKGTIATLQMTIDEASMTSNGATKKIDVSPLLTQGRVFIPARFVAEDLGYQVTWDDKNQVVICWPQGQQQPNVIDAINWLNRQSQ